MKRIDYDKYLMALTDGGELIEGFKNALATNASSVKDQYFIDNMEILQKLKLLISVIPKKIIEPDEIGADVVSDDEINTLKELAENIGSELEYCNTLYIQDAKKSLSQNPTIPIISEQKLQEEYSKSDDVKKMVDDFAAMSNGINSQGSAPVTQQPFPIPQVKGGNGKKIDDMVAQQQAINAAMPGINMAMPKALMICFADGTSMIVMEDKKGIALGQSRGGFQELINQAATVINQNPGVKYQMYKLDGKPCKLVPSYSLDFGGNENGGNS